jgi:HAD superfamily hydrolase (TIGR01509 family)
MIMKSIELIIFDCDGVLVDSELIANTVFMNILNELGLNLTLNMMYKNFVGHSSTQCMHIIEKMLGASPPANLEDRYKEEINQALKKHVKPVNGIADVLNNLTIPYCVASSGTHEKMNTTLGATDLLKYFKGKMFSTTEVPEGKPHPDIYLYAAKKMGVAPQHCLVVEDTPLGVQGGISAGMTVFGYAELMSSQRLLEAGAHLTFNNMNILINHINDIELSKV